MDSYLWPLVGGLSIGAATSLMLWGLGRITGISGIYSVTLDKPGKDHFWKYSFILGLVIGGLIMNRFVPGDFFNYSVEGSPLRVVIAGLLVGFGTRLGNGCTSGHGVCGLARQSKRSLVATLTFIASGMMVLAIERFAL